MGRHLAKQECNYIGGYEYARAKASHFNGTVVRIQLGAARRLNGQRSRAKVA